jgi:hypothetical protein
MEVIMDGAKKFARASFKEEGDDDVDPDLADSQW